MRSSLRRLVATGPGRRVAGVAARARHLPGPLGRWGEAADRLVAGSMYDGSYYRSVPDAARDGRSGYADYRRETSNADALAVAVTTWFDVDRSLDVGCAAGFFVAAMRELGVDARGTDVSDAAFELAPPAVRPHLAVADVVAGIDEVDGALPLVTAFEVLEHVPPKDAPAAVTEIARISSAYVVATIPSYGANPSGPDGWFEGKVADAALPHYLERGEGDGTPIPHADLARDAEGRLVEGHVTIASYGWWSERFAEAGFVRCHDTEAMMHHDLARYGLREFVCLYVFRRGGVDEVRAAVRSFAEVAELERRHGLLDHGAPPDHVEEALADLRDRGLSPREPAPG